MRFTATILFLVCFGQATTALGAEPWLTSGDYANLHIVVDESAPEPEDWAARRFQRHWSEVTGHEITMSDRPAADMVNVLIGEAASRLLAAFTLPDLGPEGFVIRTSSASAPGDVVDGKYLVIAGGTPTGTLYGEWEFFERYLGARVFTPGALFWPEPPRSIAAIDFQFEPAFEYRDLSYFAFSRRDWFANFHRLNGHWSGVPDQWGGHIRYARRGEDGFGHTFHDYVNPDEYFDTHPEYFAEIDGERVEEAQLCLTNPDVLGITIEGVRDTLRNAAPNERIVSVSQMDYFWFDSWCTCANCRAVDDHERSHSGTIIHFVNRVADAVAGEFPEARIDTLAYMYSRKPPKHVRPRDNVIVRISAIECDYSRPLNDRRSPRNRAFVRDLKRWANITRDLYVWDYTQNWYSHQGPHPNLHVLQPNLEFFAKQGVRGVYEQASAWTQHSDFDVLKGYILARSLWDPEVDWRGLYDEFVRHWYAEAAPYIDEYLDLITARVLQRDVVLTMANRMQWMDYDLVEQAEAIFARAFAAAKSEDTVRRLKRAYIPVQYAALVCPPRVTRTRDAYVLVRPPSQTFDEYWAMLEEYRVTRLHDEPIEAFRERLDGETPPRHETLPIEKLRNDYLEMWVVPARAGAVVRLRDWRTRREYLGGYRDILRGGGRIQEWAVIEDDRWAEPEPLDMAFDVVARGRNSIVLEAEMENGLKLTRTLRLVPDARAVEYTLTVSNPGEEAVETEIVFQSDFSVDGLGKGQLWMERDGRWTKERLTKAEDFAGYAGERSSEGVTRWAYRFPKGHKTLVASVDSESVERLSYRYFPGRVAASLGQIMTAEPIAPGEARVLRARIEIMDAKPSAL